ncbi:hypothetical protein RHMOL_Rhmol03G0233900 [Rhododendron molle]|uniref:Uncharacterized protein n=1 Tax=Rhododendron molle TaxID=49168 RepID=A0ACC0PJW4_RHOML|nr:hypothetical protein RHMOL_Rhmol03G0233900 [Rhododendron molle]
MRSRPVDCRSDTVGRLGGRFYGCSHSTGRPSCLVCPGLHCRRPVSVAGLYIWERPARLNGEVGLRWFVRRGLAV